MRVFVSGATGVIGRRAVTRLVAAGHTVTAIARTPEKAAGLRAAGATPVTVSIFDRGALTDAVAGHEGVVNLATRIPPLWRASRPRAWVENARIRTEGSANLVDAAIAAGATVFVQESLAFLYGDHGDTWVGADRTPLRDSLFTAAVRAAESNVERFGAAGGRGVVLRFGTFTAAGSHHTDARIAAARRGVALDAGDRDGYLPAVDADDAAAAVVAALDAPPGTYDVVVDEPTTRGAQDDALAAMVGRRRLRRAPRPFRARLRATAGPLADSQRVSNRRWREATPWRPAAPDVETALRVAAGPGGPAPALRAGVRLVLWMLLATGLAVGVWAQFFPSAFYDDFPFGRGWVAMEGPFNEHLLRDVGSFNLALAAVTIVALAGAARVAAVGASVGWLVYSLPHAVYHSFHLEHMGRADAVALVGSVWFTPVAAAIALVLLSRPIGQNARRDGGRRTEAR